MRLTIIAPDNVYEHEVDPSMEIQDVQALIEAETGLPATAQVLSNDSGVQMTDTKRSLESYGVAGQASSIFLTLPNAQPVASTSYAPPPSQSGFPSSDSDLERMRLQALGDPRLMADLRAVRYLLLNHELELIPFILRHHLASPVVFVLICAPDSPPGSRHPHNPRIWSIHHISVLALSKLQNDPEMASAIQAGTQRFKEAFMRQQLRMRQAALEKDRQIEVSL
ncbi:hypothetical protein BCR39DRAFT_341251 [Naematelia encephala]|uniref:Ubiquitin-like domain-containing protein n=1 Tax=Naematelia encephala TaxID=71784 RepID=A0A1Y2AN68_9TREE|nr:hypothetical protein BCR39DRAFT_341251 [Naematelia encephala]